MTNRSFFIMLQNFSSDPFPYNSACPQGSTLAPTLFNIFINGLSEDLKIDHLLFADDLIFFVNDIHFDSLITKLQVSLNLVNE